MPFDIPRGLILPVDAVDIRLQPGPHPFAEENAAAIAANWQRERAEKPALFDGEVMLLSHMRYSARRLEGACHLVRYSAFLLWRRLRPLPSADHAFAHAALVSSDNALIAIRMGGHTVNAGRIYFAAGSFERCDFRDGQVDLPFNMEREVREETGIDLAGAPCEPGFQIWSDVAGTAIFRRYFLPEPAETIAAGIAGFAAREADPEIAGPVIIRSADDLPDGLMPHMAGLVRWHFGRARQAFH